MWPLIFAVVVLTAPPLVFADASILVNEQGTDGACHFPVDYAGGEVRVIPCDISLVVFSNTHIRAGVGTAEQKGREERVLPVVNEAAPCHSATVRNNGVCLIRPSEGTHHLAGNWVSRVFECKNDEETFDVSYYLFCGPAVIQ